MLRTYCWVIVDAPAGPPLGRRDGRAKDAVRDRRRRAGSTARPRRRRRRRRGSSRSATSARLRGSAGTTWRAACRPPSRSWWAAPLGMRRATCSPAGPSARRCTIAYSGRRAGERQQQHDADEHAGDAQEDRSMLAFAGFDEALSACSNSSSASEPDGTLWLTSVRNACHQLPCVIGPSPSLEPPCTLLTAPLPEFSLLPAVLKRSRRHGQRRRRGLPRGRILQRPPRSAENFAARRRLRETCDFAHLRGVRVYLTRTCVVLPDEMRGRAATSSTGRGRQGWTPSSCKISASLGGSVASCRTSGFTRRPR